MKQLIDIQTAAKALDIEPSTLYNKVSRREIPFVKVGRLTKFDPDAIDAWIKQHTIRPLSAPTQRLRKILPLTP